MNKTTANNYNADSIQSLEGIEHVRLRPSMYIGDVGPRGLHHLVYEVVDNSIDEALAGYCDKVWVTIHVDNSISVLDNGRGIPIDIHKKEGKSALEVVMTKIGAGGKFDKDSYKVSGGLHGVGVSCVNALSSHLRAKVYRDGKIYSQTYATGKAMDEVQVIGQTNQRGTEIHFRADDTIFKITEYNYDTLAARLRELAFLNKGLSIFLSDERTADKKGQTRRETFFSEGGLKEFILFIEGSREPLIQEVISIEGERENIPVEVAMRYNTSFNENLHSYVNNINTQEGGTHLAGFRRALTRTLKKYADESGLLAKEKVEITGDDFREGLTAVISVKVMEPQFEGQTKTKLGNNEASGVVDRIVGEMLSAYLEEHPAEAKKIVEKVLLAARARQAAKKAREMVQRKSPMGGGGLPGKLADCSSSDPGACEIYMVEGDSAGGTAKQGRDREFQAILPLRGKILNVEKAMQYKVFESEEIRNIFAALGVSIGTEEDSKALNTEKLRYHKIIIMTDADIDGSHISTLILTFFFRYMKNLIENGHIYIATPPLYLVKKGSKYTYAWHDKEREQIIEEFGGSKGVNVQRYKGLGEMNAEQLWDTTMNPQNRTLRQITIENATEADRIFSMLMGDDVPPRREFIEKNAIYAHIDA
ncbi:DNA topoisomerase (ATP-hydrolyzing) subunit B [Bacteroidetes bacterium endosymbiont of Geopemphigus sp.]|uniref:DNA topoisomerase (ATP-hydrolyzing) subunit B n=1 Tax=Bacteroidetes bacterium endosymbiont of Geopemphigus sp. TaxID=2047937 RepID=UPI000CD1EFCE|nr:DNA topoisomerase (ATP-hydrolyzing) subunit B [Bacteroidetes bacterium endosymbiont of Geopemphigus sp.]